jgi:hypothetical protein
MPGAAGQHESPMVALVRCPAPASRQLPPQTAATPVTRSRRDACDSQQRHESSDTVHT